MKSAVLFLVFNRPDTTQEVFNAIRAAQPPRLYIAADGPRVGREGEHDHCEEVRRIATAVDWPCDIKTLFHDKNLGCNLGPFEGISWFFRNEEEGIILEDDILPLPTFFQYCDELLERYRYNEKVGVISGCNIISKRFSANESYFFSRYNHVWGWASWRRAWALYDGSMLAWPAWRDSGGLTSISDGSKVFEYSWGKRFNKAFKGGVDYWDYQWTFTCWYHGMLSTIPAHNQTRNVGFGINATHTTGGVPDYVEESLPELLTFPLRHPASLERNTEADALIGQRAFGMNNFAEIKLKIRQPFLSIGTLLRRLKKGS